MNLMTIRSDLSPRKLLISAGFIAALYCSPALASEQTALDRYVAAPDAHYGYTFLHNQKADDFTAYVLEMTSQQWLTENEVNKPIWKHWVTIIKPKEISSQTGLLF